MSRKWQNVFFVFGMVALVGMAVQVDYAEARNCLLGAGIRFPIVLVLWAFLYIFNTFSWKLIINSGGRAEFGFLWLYKVTVSGFALNYATPMGLMGGEPYRIMELASVIGTERASSSVILYVMTHIFSHFWFWLLTALLYLFVYDVSSSVAAVILFAILFSALGVCLFISAYRHGLTVRLVSAISKLPLVGRFASGCLHRNMDKLKIIDGQIASFNQQNKRVLVLATLLELVCRIFSAAEIYVVMSLIVPEVNYTECVLMLAFTSLFANLLFFMPLQIGGREGGFIMSAAGLGLGSAAGVVTALTVRLRELVWTGIGLLLIKYGKGKGGCNVIAK